MENPANPEKTANEVFGDYLKEIVGYETGLLRTIIDLRKQPAVVLQGYVSKDTKYVGPFRILLSALSLWVLVNSFFLDWYKAWENACYKMAGWMTYFFPIPAHNQSKFDKMMEFMATMYGKFAGDLFAKYYVPFIIITLPLTAYIASKKCREYGVDLKTLLAALAYSGAMNVIVMFVVSVSAYFSVLITFGAIGIPILILALIGKGHYIMLLPIRRFFDSKAIEIEKKLTRSMMVSVCLLLFPLLIYWVSQILSTWKANQLI